MSGAGARADAQPRVFTIPAGTPFLETFVTAFQSGALFGLTQPLTPEIMAAARIFVPTRRAGAALAQAMASVAPSRATILPRILPLGDGAALGSEPLTNLEPGASVDLPPVISDHSRRLALFGMVEAWRRAMSELRNEQGEREPFYVASTPSDAYALSGDLARLIDETIIEDVPLSRLAEALPDAYDPSQHDQYWTLTQRFLAIAATQWPLHLAELGRIDSAEALKHRFRAYARWLAANPPEGPVVVAGSTGSVSATADLMATVARLPLGAVVLPGLDLVTDDATWDLVGHERSDLPTRFAHPQVLLKRTLSRIGIARSDVHRLGAQEPLARERLVAALFRPAVATADWATMPVAPEALAGVRLIVADHEHEEALAIALALREALETPGTTAALVTPDRTLARMVSAELERWGIHAADSAGQMLAGTRAGALASLCLEATMPGARAADMLALLRHPDIASDEQDRREAADALEIAALRGRRISGLADLVAAIRDAAVSEPDRHAPPPRKRITDEAMDGAVMLAESLAAALDPLVRVFADGAAPLRSAALAHRASLQGLRAGTAEPPSRADELALALLFDTLTGDGEDGPRVTASDYARIFSQMLAEAVVPPSGNAHPRIKIWGLLEARLLDADRVVLAGLDDGVWPPDVRNDPFLNRPMRIALGLQPPERRIGQTAHDFMMLLGGRDVILTRADMRQGSPTVVSRFLRRLIAFAGEGAEQQMAVAGEPYLAWARALDMPETVAPVERPEPRVPPQLMPTALNVTEVETLYRDPYVIFARRVLGLHPLDPLDPLPGARERGIVVHDILAAYAARLRDNVPNDPDGLLLSLAREGFSQISESDPETIAFWQRRFEAFIPWFVDWDRKRRTLIKTLHSEVDGRFDLPIGTGAQVRLTTRADRIEERRDGSFAIVDYKTGTAPSGKSVLAGLSPQLPLTAALLKRGAFARVPNAAEATTFDLSYLEVAKTGGQGKDKSINPEKQPMDEVIEQQFAFLQQHLGEYLAGLRAFVSRRQPARTAYTSDYDHLARYLEWSQGGEDEEGEPE